MGTMAGQVTEITGKDGQKWRVRFSLEGLSWFERQTGVRAAELADRDVSTLWLDEMAALFACGLYHENRDVSVSDGFEMMESLDNDQAAALMRAFARDQGIDLPDDPNQQPQENQDTKKNRSGTGTKSKQAQPVSG